MFDNRQISVAFVSEQTFNLKSKERWLIKLLNGRSQIPSAWLAHQDLEPQYQEQRPTKSWEATDITLPVDARAPLRLVRYNHRAQHQ